MQETTDVFDNKQQSNSSNVFAKRCLIPIPIKYSKVKFTSEQTSPKVSIPGTKQADTSKQMSQFSHAVHRKEKHSGVINPSIRNAKDKANNKHLNKLESFTTKEDLESRQNVLRRSIKNKRFGLVTSRVIEPG